jgi:hypothetical protein
MRASDGHLYVVKFKNNPQGIRVLVAELIATRLAVELGLTSSLPVVIDVRRSLIRETRDLCIYEETGKRRCEPGLCFGSLHASKRGEAVLDYIPRAQLHRVVNRDEFAGALIFDLWTGNSDNLQVVFRGSHRAGAFEAVFIDHGYCFRELGRPAGERPKRLWVAEWGADGITSWESFQPWLWRIETIDTHALWRCTSGVPEEWVERSQFQIEQLVEELARRKIRVRDAVLRLRETGFFPNWGRRARFSATRGDFARQAV